MSDVTNPAAGAPDGLAERMTSYRATREHIERHTLPLATSVDGVTFEFQASLYGLSLERGCYVMLAGDDGARLGQVTDIFSDTARVEVDGEVAGASSIVLRVARGSGLVLDQVGTSFHDATVRLAEPQEVAAVLARANPDRAGLTIGELFHAPGVPAVLDSGGFNRHTSACAASPDLARPTRWGCCWSRCWRRPSCVSSSWTPTPTTWGWAGCGETRPPGRGPLSAGTGSGGRVGQRRAGRPPAATPVRKKLDTEAQAATLGLDPVRDRDEYAVLADLLRQTQAGKQLIGLDQLEDSDTPGPVPRPARRQSGRARLGHLGGDQPWCSRSWRTRAPAAPWSTWARSAGSRNSGWSPRPSSRDCGRCGDPATLPDRARRGAQHLRRRSP